MVWQIKLQMLLFNFREINDQRFEFPFRMFISGSSQSGKTTFAGKILASNLFREKISSVLYYHPDYLDNVPVKWHNTLSIPVCYKSGQPTMDELTSLEENTCVVLDDIYEECIHSKPIDYLFRVLSGKKKISVMIMSQRYFTKGRFAMTVRNNVNFTVLMRNTDARINKQIVRVLNVEKEFEKVSAKNQKYPYVFIDTSPSALESGYRVYDDIFSSYKRVISDDGMRGYVISEKQFERFFKVINSTTATVKNENQAEISREESTEPSRAIERKRATKSFKDEKRKLAKRARRLRDRRRSAKIISEYKKQTKLLGENN